MRRLVKPTVAFCLLALVFGLPACVNSSRLRWPVCSPTSTRLNLSRNLADAEFARAGELEDADDESCVDAYFTACSLAWQTPTYGPHGASFPPDWQLYNTSLCGLLRSAQRFGRLDAYGLQIRTTDAGITVPVVHHEFPWGATDFQQLHPPPTGREPLLSRRYVCPGIGVPLVIERCRDDRNSIETRFFPEKSHFAATALLRFCNTTDSAEGQSAVLEFHNPQHTRRLSLEGVELPLAMDLSAPLAKTLEEAPRSYLAGFIAPGGGTTTARLSFLEPYQSGKVPVLLIHGLYADPQSWADLVNDLRATPGFHQRHQLWVFRYPTGQGFLQSAARLRSELAAALCNLDPSRADPALRKVTLIGHSMGGLIAKLQVTYSEELVWSRLANRPLEEIATTESTRAFLAEACYFDPSPDVATVIFIASPHCGSLASSALAGQGASWLVKPSPQQAAMHEQLMRDNPSTFNPLVERRLPTSIDMLMAESPLLQAMRQMRWREGVTLHNIIGSSHPISLDGPSDGVVSVASAWHPECDSELILHAGHTRIHRHEKTSAEVLRILNDPSRGCRRLAQ
jgi:pimeloyl-ACP methyl ester carboxylesterase